MVDKARALLRDEHGTVAQDVERMRRIARVSARKKHYAADLIEELLYDGKFSLATADRGLGRRRRPVHLETADVRMSAWRAKNWDLAFVGILSVASLVGLRHSTTGSMRRRG